MTEEYPVDERELVRSLNEQAFVGLMEQYHMTLHGRNQNKWRPTVPTDGMIQGLEHLGELQCIATDGLLGWFLNAVGECAEYHVTHFQWTNPVVSMVPYYDAETQEHKFFKSTKDHGAPGARFRTTPPVREKKPSQRTKPKSKRRQFLDSL